MTNTHSKRYVSKSPRFMFHIRGAINAYVTDAQGAVREREIEPELFCEFQMLVLKSSDENVRYDKAFATRHFYPKSGWRDHGEAPGHVMLGAVPSLTPVAMLRQGADGKREISGMTEGYDPTMHFGVFYLDWIPDEKRRAEAEKALDEHGLNGSEYIEVIPEALPLPWPSYMEMRKGAGADKACAAFAKAGGVDPYLVIAFEDAQTDRKQAIIDRCQELAESLASDAADEASLERAL